MGEYVHAEACRCGADGMSEFNVFTRSQPADPSADPSSGGAPPEQPNEKMLPMQRITAMIMRGNAQAQGQALAKKLSDEHVDALSKVTLTLKPNPNGGEPLATIKDAPLSAINQTHDQNVKDAYTGPSKDVETVIGAQNAPAAPSQDQTALNQMYDANDASYGKHLPRPSDVDKLLQTPQGIQELTFALGGNKDHVARYVKMARDPQLREQLASKARAKLVELHHSIYADSKQAIDDSQQNTRENRIVKQEEFERSASVIKGTDWSSVEPGQELTEFKSQMGRDATAAEQGTIARTKRDQIGKKLDAQYDASLKDKETLGAAKTYDAVVQEYGPAKTKELETRRQAVWQASRDDRIEKARLADQKERNYQDRQDRIEREHQATIERLTREKPEKPYKLKAHEVDMLPAETLAATVGDDMYDQNTAIRGVATRRGKLTSQLQDLTAKIHGAKVEFQSQAPLAYDQDLVSGQWTASESKSKKHPLAYSRAADAQKNMTVWGEEVANIQKSLAALGGAPAPVAPKSSAAPAYNQTGTVHLSNGSTVRAGTNDGKAFFDLATGKPVQ